MKNDHRVAWHLTGMQPPGTSEGQLHPARQAPVNLSGSSSTSFWTSWRDRETLLPVQARQAPGLRWRGRGPALRIPNRKK